MSFVVSVERLTITLADTVASATANLTQGQSVSDCFPIASWDADSSATNYDDTQVMIEFLTGPDRVQVSRGGTSGQVVVEVAVVEVDPLLVQVETNTGSMPPFTIGFNSSVPINTALYFSRAFGLHYSKGTGSGLPRNFLTRLELSDINVDIGTNVDRGSASTGTIDFINYVIADIDGNQFNTQQFSISLASSAGSGQDTLTTAVDEAVSALFGSCTNASTSTDPQESSLELELVGGSSGARTQVEVRRNAVAVAAEIRGAVVTFLDGTSVQQINQTIPSSSASAGFAMSSVNLALAAGSTPIQPGSRIQENIGAGGGYGRTRLNTATTGTVSVGTALTAAIDWQAEVIAFASGQTFERTITDTIGLADSPPVAEMTFDRVLQDTIAAVDVVTRWVSYVRSVTDSVTVTDRAGLGAPVFVRNVQPAAGTTIPRWQVVEFDVASAGNLTLLAIDSVLPSGLLEPVYADGSGFTSAFAIGSSALAQNFGNDAGLHVAVARREGWGASPIRLRITAQAGGIAPQVFEVVIADTVGLADTVSGVIDVPQDPTSIIAASDQLAWHRWDMGITHATPPEVEQWDDQTLDAYPLDVVEDFRYPDLVGSGGLNNHGYLTFDKSLQAHIALPGTGIMPTPMEPHIYLVYRWQAVPLSGNHYMVSIGQGNLFPPNDNVLAMVATATGWFHIIRTGSGFFFMTPSITHDTNWHLAELWYDGANLNFRQDNGSVTSVAANGTFNVSLQSAYIIGSSDPNGGSSTAAYDVGECFSTAQQVSGPNHTALIAYLNGYWNGGW